MTPVLTKALLAAALSVPPVEPPAELPADHTRPAVPAAAVEALDRLTAVALIHCPPGTEELPEPPVPLEALRKVAVELELLDPREAEWWFRDGEDYRGELDQLRWRNVEFGDSPRVSAADSLPSEAELIEARKFNREFRECLEARISVEHDRAARLREVLKEAGHLDALYGDAFQAKCEANYVADRRRALGKVLGVTNGGPLPPPVPDRLFRVRD